VEKIREYLIGLAFAAFLVFWVMIWGFLEDPIGESNAGRMAMQVWCWVTVITLMMIGVVAEKRETT